MLKKKISSALAIVLCLLAVLFSFAPSTRAAQAKQSEEAAAIEAFKTFVKYAQIQDGRAWSLFTAQSQNLFIEMGVDAAVSDPNMKALMQKEGMSRQDLVQLMKVELANPNSEMAKACWAEASKYFPTEDISNVEFTAVISGNTATISSPGSSGSLTMIKENGQWKVDAMSVMGQ